MKERVILGKNCIYSTDSSQTGINNNRVIVGGSGTGKTMSVLEPELLELLRGGESSMIVVATKRRLVDKYAEPLKEKGYQIYDLNFAEPEKSNCCYDPLQYIRTEEDLLNFATAVVMANEQKARGNGDPFWTDSAISMLAAECAVVLGRNPHSFATVMHLNKIFSIRGDGMEYTTTLDKIFEEEEERNPQGYALKYWKSFRTNPEKTSRCVYTALNTALDKLFTDSVCQLMRNKPEIDFQKVSEQKSVIFVTTSPVKKSLHMLAQMFISQAVKELFEIAERRPDGRLLRPVHISFDDFATGGRCENFPEYISIFREKGIASTILLQSEAQLRQMYGNDAVTILDNCDSYVYLGGNNVDTAKNISIRLNLPLDEVLYMPVGKMVVFRRGQKPVITDRYDIYQDPDYQKITENYKKWVQERSQHVYQFFESSEQSVGRETEDRSGEIRSH